jgi:exosome complex component RRP42
MDAISTIKSNYMKELLAKGTREDGRGLMETREITIKAGVISHAEGSAQVDIGSTRVLAGIKIDMEEPLKDLPNQGSFAVSSELLPLASADYESGPPSPESIELSRVTDRGIRAAECIDLESLFVEEGKAWSIFVDIYVLNYDGNLFDAAELAAMTAIATAKMPKYVDGKVIRDGDQPLKVKNIVASTTFAKIGNNILADPNGMEESSAATRITIVTDGKTVRAVQKGMSGGWTPKEIYSLIDASMDKYKDLKKKIEKQQV